MEIEEESQKEGQEQVESGSKVTVSAPRQRQRRAAATAAAKNMLSFIAEEKKDTQVSIRRGSSLVNEKLTPA